MDVAVDAARQHQQTGRIDLARRSLDFGGDRDDAPRADADIRSKRVGSGRNGAAANGKIQLRHFVSPLSIHTKPQAAVHPPSTID